MAEHIASHAELQLPLVALRDSSGNEAPGEPHNITDYSFERIGEGRNSGEIIKVNTMDLPRGATEIQGWGPFRYESDNPQDTSTVPLPGMTRLEIRTGGRFGSDESAEVAEQTARFIAFLADCTQDKYVTP